MKLLCSTFQLFALSVALVLQPSHAFLGSFFTGLASIFIPGLFNGACDDVMGQLLLPPVGAVCQCNTEISTFLFFFVSAVDVTVDCTDTSNQPIRTACTLTAEGSAGLPDLWARRIHMRTTDTCPVSMSIPLDGYTFTQDTTVGLVGNVLTTPPLLESCSMSLEPYDGVIVQDCGCDACLSDGAFNAVSLFTPGATLLQTDTISFDCSPARPFLLVCPPSVL